MRSGVLLETASERLLLDCSPDILRQLERVDATPDSIDGVIISHRHNDHCFGLYDLVRTRSEGAAPLRVYCGADTEELLRRAMPALVRESGPLVAFSGWAPEVRLSFDGLTVVGFDTHHGPGIETTAMVLEALVGGRAVRVAYATDMVAEMPSPRSVLEPLDLFVGDGTTLGAGGLGHPGTDRMIEIARELGAKRVAITHVGHWGLAAADGAAAVADDVAICRDGDDLFSFLA